MRAFVSAFCLVLFLAGSIGWADEPEEEAAAIRKRAEEYVAAYNRGDAAALADLWSEHAVYVNRDTGERIQGRPAIAVMFQTLFAGDDQSQLSVTIEAIRLITTEVAIEDGTAEIVSATDEPFHSTYTAVHVKKDGVWYLDSVRETDTPAPPPEEAGPLDELAWLVGEWLDQDEDAAIRTRWEWAKNKHFLTSTFSVSIGDNVELEGTQVIGWDAAAGHIRSWVFDSEGGFGEGVWRRVGNQWIVDSTSSMRDGSQGSAVNIYRLIDDNTFTWKSVDRQVNGEPLTDISEVPVYRQ